MSTRATLTVRNLMLDGAEAYSIYRHMDGYPFGEHGVLRALPLALAYAWPLPRFEASDFAAAIVAAWKRPARRTQRGTLLQGGDVYMTGGRDSHGDTDYHYELYPSAGGRVAVQCFISYEDEGRRAWKPEGSAVYLTYDMQPPPVDLDSL